MDGTNNHTVVQLKKGEGRTVKSGGLWIYDNEIDRISGRFRNGEMVTVCDFDGYPLGRGYINQNSRIRIRMMTRNAAQEMVKRIISEYVPEFVKMRDRIIEKYKGESI